MSELFDTLGISSQLVEALRKSAITKPTEIQRKVIPLAMEKKDIIGQSGTGTGKTLAFLLPLFMMVDKSKKEMQAIILAPTHELAMQIHNEIKNLSKNSGTNISSAAIIGSANINRQVERLKEKPHIIVGSPGRILELIKKRKISAHTIKTIIIDEGDKLLDPNNIEIVKAVIKTTLKERQVMLFSATIPVKTLEVAKEFMKDPEVIKVSSKKAITNNIDHYYLLCDERDKIKTLRKLVHALKPEKALVFINKSYDIEKTVARLNYHKLKAQGLHGTNRKEDRKKVLQDLRLGKLQLLVASDIAARGLDIKGVSHVFNLELPEDPKDYLHRAGRTGRAGKRGEAITIASKREVKLIHTISRTYKIHIGRKEVLKGQVVNPKTNRD
ncbi:MAG: DEAD/DEAH box helicase [Clostridia bacterium]|jgi:superfamily II DNA/RNA helicase|nr:DEAD/DEAH box helicase [Clostridia bacterium]